MTRDMSQSLEDGLMGARGAPLLRGERGTTIARDLFLGQGTVRNHLSAIYRRPGVHSQAELLARMLPSRPPSAPDDE